MSSEPEKPADACSPELPRKPPPQQARRASELCLPEAGCWGGGRCAGHGPAPITARLVSVQETCVTTRLVTVPSYRPPDLPAGGMSGVVTQRGKLRRALGRAHGVGLRAGWPGCKHLPPSCLPMKYMVGFLAKQKKSEDSEDREMKTVLWAEKAVPPGQPALGQLSL